MVISPLWRRVLAASIRLSDATRGQRRFRFLLFRRRELEPELPDARDGVCAPFAVDPFTVDPLADELFAAPEPFAALDCPLAGLASPFFALPLPSPLAAVSSPFEAAGIWNSFLSPPAARGNAEVSTSLTSITSSLVDEAAIAA
jgi:hypothetical protein